MIYIIDHKDSFTYNLVHLLSNFDKVYVSNYNKINNIELKKSKLIDKEQIEEDQQDVL